MKCLIVAVLSILITAGIIAVVQNHVGSFDNTVQTFGTERAELADARKFQRECLDSGAHLTVTPRDGLIHMVCKRKKQ